MSHLGSLWGGVPGVTFESLLGHFHSFWVSVKLGARRFPNQRITMLDVVLFSPALSCLPNGWVGPEEVDKFSVPEELLLDRMWKCDLQKRIQVDTSVF